MSSALFPLPDEIQCFQRALMGAASGWDLRYLVRTSSTNEEATRAAKAGSGHGTVFLAEEQTAGRGQRGRSWDSPSGLGLLFSVVVRGLELTPDRMGWVALSAGLGCIRGLQTVCDGDLRLKWPNDLVYLDPQGGHPPWRKLGGILVESRLSEHRKVDYAVVGIGINVLHATGDFPKEVRTPATSLALLDAHSVDRRQVLKAVLEALAEHVQWIVEEGTFAAMTAAVRSAFSEWWQPWDLRVALQERESSAHFEDLDARGRCCLVLPPARHSTPFAEVEWLDAVPRR